MRNFIRDTRTQPIRNLQPNPVPTTSATWTGAGVAHTATFTTNSLGMKCFKITQSVTGSTAIYASRNNGGFGPIASGEKYTFLCWVEADFTGLLQIVAGSGTGPQVFDSTRLEFAVQPNTPQLIRLKFTIPATGATQSHFKIVAPSSNPSTAAYSVAKVMVTAGWYDGEYSDGYTPGWKWTGTPGTSTSIGWPYTLESIAGKPAVARTTYGPTPFNQAEGASVTLFGVYDINASPTVGWDSFGQIQNSSSTAMMTLERRNGSPFTEGWVRGNTSTGSQLTIATANGSTLGRHVLGASFDAAVPRVRAAQDSTLYSANWAGLNPNASATSYYLPPPYPDNRTVPLYGAVYSRALSNAELLGVSRWLANKYGAPAPQGEAW